MLNFKCFLEATRIPDDKELNGFWADVKRRDNTLPDAAQKAITAFVGHPIKGGDSFNLGLMQASALEDAYSPKPSEDGKLIRKQLEDACLPLKNKLSVLYGTHIPLYRSQTKDVGNSVRHILSFSMCRDFVDSWKYGGERPQKYFRIETLHDGFWSVLSEDDEEYLKIKEYKEQNPFHWFFDSKKDAKKIVDVLKELNPEMVFKISLDDYSLKIRARDNSSQLQCRLVPVDDIIWITNRIGQKEFIVKNKDYVKLSYDRLK